jgi:HK97 family phage major capsid protein
METQDLDQIANSVKEFSGATKAALVEQAQRLLAIEQTLTAPRGCPRGGDGSESIGGLITKSEGFKALAKGGRSTGAITVGRLHKDGILNQPGLDQPLVPMYRVPGIVMPGLQRLTIRDLVPSFPVDSNMIAFAKETSSTNAAAPQAGENVLKAESALAFSLLNSPVQTLAHWIPASRQIIDDAPALEAYVNSRLVYQLKFVEERQLLNGDGVGSDLSGLILNSTPFDTTQTISADTMIDTIQRAITQTNQDSNLEADGIVLNNLDWAAIQLIKTTGTASSGQYIYANPHNAAPAQLWGLPVVPTKSMARGNFLVGAFRMAAAIWDRDDATVEVSREHADFFIRNMVAILCEERLALTVFRPEALIYGSFPFGS